MNKNNTFKNKLSNTIEKNYSYNKIGVYEINIIKNDNHQYTSLIPLAVLPNLFYKYPYTLVILSNEVHFDISLYYQHFLFQAPNSLTYFSYKLYFQVK